MGVAIEIVEAPVPLVATTQEEPATMVIGVNLLTLQAQIEAGRDRGAENREVEAEAEAGVGVDRLKWIY